MTLIPTDPASSVLAEFIDILGLDSALYLARVCGSRPLYVPGVRPSSARLRHLSAEQLERLRAEYGGIQLRRFPQARRWFVRQMHWRMIDALNRGESPRVVAQRFDCTEVWVCQVARGILAANGEEPGDPPKLGQDDINPLLGIERQGGCAMNERFFSNVGVALRILWGLGVLADKVSKILADGKVTDQELIQLVGEGVFPLLREVGVRGLPDSDTEIAREVSISLKA